MADVAVFSGVAGESEDDRDLRALLSDDDGRADFAAFCESEHSEENIKFWESIQQFKLLAAETVGSTGGEAGGDGGALDALSEFGVKIVRTYVASFAPFKVNMEDSAREELAEHVKVDCRPDVFDVCERVVFKQMKVDTFRRYVASGRLESFRAARRFSTLSIGTESSSGDVLETKTQSEIALMLRKRAFLGVKIGRTHSKKEKKLFDRLGDSVRAQAIKSGFLLKRGDKVQSWTRRWVVASPLLLGYFTDEYQRAPKRVVLFSEVLQIDCRAAAVPDRRFGFALKTKGRDYCFQAASSRDLERWTRALSGMLSMEPLRDDGEEEREISSS